MKKFLLAVALILSTLGANAQISVKKSNTDKAVQEAVLAPAWNWLYKQGDAYFLVCKSSNQFDNNYWFKLGETKEDCLNSLKSLSDLCDSITKTDRFDIENGQGKTFSVTQYNELGVKGLTLNCEGYAGAGYAYKSAINKGVKWITNNVK